VSDVGDAIGMLRIDVEKNGKVASSQTLESTSFTDEKGNKLRGGDVFFVLTPGEYTVSATPLEEDGSESAQCSSARTSVKVKKGETTEIMLSVFCNDHGAGGLDVIVSTSARPLITNLTFTPSKVTTTCAPVDITVTAKDLDDTDLSYGWSTKTGPDAALSQLNGNANSARFTAATPGVYTLQVDVIDPQGNDATLEFPVHVSLGSNTSCLDETNTIPDAPVEEVIASPIDLTTFVASDGSGTNTTSATSKRPISFSLPEEYAIESGVIGNGTVTFGFQTPTGERVACLYRGGSSTAAPTTAEELNKGRQLHFVSCSDELPANVKRTGVAFDLTMHPMPGYSASVGSPIQRDGYCSDQLEIISAAETQRMHAAFSWSRAKKVAAKNKDGNYALYYAWIYIRNKDEALALRKLYIHTLNRPLFTEELDAYAGKCGVFTNPGDGEGMFVPVVLPGETYNKMIDALTSNQIEGDRVVFDAVIIRDVPEAMRNPNGSIELVKLAESGFRYLDYELGNSSTLPHWEDMKLDGGLARLLVKVITWIAQTAKKVGQFITNTLGKLDKLIRGRVEKRLHLYAITHDPSFGGPNDNPIMTRGWGDLSGWPLGAQGMNVTILQRLFNTFVPTTSMSKTNRQSYVAIKAVAGGATRGSGLCIELKNRAAMVTSFLMANELCDLRAFNPQTSTAPQDYHLTNFRNDESLRLHIDNTRLAGLYQATDAFEYSQNQLKFEPKRARIMAGYWADTFSPRANGGKRIYAPCLNYPNSITDIATVGSGFISSLLLGPIIGLVTAVFTAIVTNSDIVLPTNSKLKTSREVLSHEYGHYLFCGMLQEFTPFGVDHLIWATIGAGDSLQVPARYVNEAMADFFTGQVVGGHDYGYLPNAHGGRYCTKGNTPCWDANLTGSKSTPDDEVNVGRIATLLHDVFDGHGLRKSLVTPTDGDSWMQDPPMSPLTYSPEGYGDNDSTLERVALPGPAMLDIVERIAARLLPLGTGSNISDVKVFAGINDAMSARGISWCDRCRVFALHSTTRPDNESIASVQIHSLFETCMNDNLIREAIGEPPDINLRLDAATCTTCAPGYISSAEGDCVPCPTVVSGNRCETCQADVVVDPAAASIYASYNAGAVLTGDVCPETFILEVRNPVGAIGQSVDYLRANIQPTPYTESLCNRPYTLTTARESTGGFVNEPLISSTGRWDLNCGIDDTQCPPPACEDTPARTIPLTELSDKAIRFSVPVDGNTEIVLSTGFSPPPLDGLERQTKWWNFETLRQREWLFW